MHVVAVLALDGVVPFDLSVPLQVFGSAMDDGGRPRYETRVCGLGPSVRTSPVFGGIGLDVPWGLEALAEADTVLVPGHADGLVPPPEALEALRSAAARGARIASICVGAFILAASGLLDGRRATTHWAYARELARLHPSVEVDDSVLFTDNGRLLTSAGVAAGIDLCLHLVRRDHGASVAAMVARRIVMPLQRDGGQAQYIRHPDPGPPDVGLQPTLAWLEARLHLPLTLADIAGHASTSVRTLNRRFRAQVGTTPLQWLLRARLHRAQQLLESTTLPVDRVAAACGFGSSATLRAHFTRHVGTSPQSYRQAFRTGS
ncbi:GlxA family transcriptional regulator [Actinocorallia populi]|uniref:GlxA family transcriptional regulator n=1 Tax=Actinocorallia populi TaxID=2079200 RepID=UPI000D08B2AC|nr:helix-turn-helix domain-containing protein [Actinocorallia populi]